ncbi:MAG: outer membrane protein [Xanthobacteraceae bacterium]
MKSSYLLASASTLAMTGVAGAADLPVKYVPPGQVASWAGFYLGINGGVVTHQSTTKDLDNWADISYVSNNNLKSTGGTFGGQVGYNWQDDAFVYGLEADWNWTSNRAFNSISMCPSCNGGPGGTGGGAAMVRANMDWMSTIRGRAGIAVGHLSNTFMYLTGGVAFADINNRWGAGYNAGAAAARVSDSNFVSDNTKVGWVVGTGFEHMFAGAPHWTFKAEALWADFGTTTVTNPGPSTFNLDVKLFHTEFQNQAVIGRVGINFKF